MVALDNSVTLDREKVPLGLPKISLPGLIALVAAIVVFGSLAARGFSDNGFRLASQNVWRFSCFVFFAAIVVGPVGRMIPGCRRLANASRSVFWGFCASHGVYLLAVLLPNTFGPGSVVRSDPGVTLFVLFDAGVTVVMALALTPRMTALVGDGARRALLSVSVIYFWLCYTILGLAYISHPHRPDGFYGLSVSLMIIALLVRFADRYRDQWAQRPRRPAAPG